VSVTRHCLLTVRWLSDGDRDCERRHWPPSLEGRSELYRTQAWVPATFARGLLYYAAECTSRDLML